MTENNGDVLAKFAPRLASLFKIVTILLVVISAVSAIVGMILSLVMSV